MWGGGGGGEVLILVNRRTGEQTGQNSELNWNPRDGERGAVDPQKAQVLPAHVQSKIRSIGDYYLSFMPQCSSMYKIDILFRMGYQVPD